MALVVGRRCMLRRWSACLLARVGLPGLVTSAIAGSS
jgi:hypothetical protein